jgi:6-phosphogluconate dehydrogenase
VTVQALSAIDDATGSPLIDVVADEAGMKGTGLWTVQAALALGVNVGAISEAVSARLLSGREHLRSLSERDSSTVVPPQAAALGQGLDRDAVVEAARAALYAAKVVAYAQGFDLIRSGSTEYGWDVDLAAVAGIWRGGCIIRATLLEDIRAAYGSDPELATLLGDPALAGALQERLVGWRKLVATAVSAGLPVPVLSSTLAYYDSVRATRLPTSLIQAQRDIFGAHTYRRVDRAGVFHRDWSGSGEERIVRPA